MKIAGKSLVILLMVGILLASCAPQPPDATMPPDIGASLTAGVGTIVAYFFETQTAMAPPASETPSITPIPQASTSPIAFPTLGTQFTPTPNLVYLSPTPTGTFYTATPNAGSLAYGCYNMGFIQDLQTPDGTVLQPNQSFVREWRVINNGTCNWLFGFRLAPVSGYQFAEDPVSPSGSGPATVNEWRRISVNGRAPDDPGTYTQYWRMTDGAGHSFGVTLSISIIVRAPTNTPRPATATNTANPTATNTPNPTATNTPNPTATATTAPVCNPGDPPPCPQ